MLNSNVFVWIFMLTYPPVCYLIGYKLGKKYAHDVPSSPKVKKPVKITPKTVEFLESRTPEEIFNQSENLDQFIKNNK